MNKKITKNKIIAACMILCVLAAAYFFGGGYADKTSAPDEAAAVAATTAGHVAPSDFPAVSQGNQGQTAGPKETAGTEKAKPSETSGTAFAKQSQGKTAKEETKSQANSGASFKSSVVSSSTTDAETGRDQSVAVPASPAKPKPTQPQDAEKINTAHTCTLSVTCKTILDNMNRFNKNKLKVLPSNGVIFPAVKATFYEGESVFNVLQREMKKAGIQMEFATAPIYHSNYIEGINNLYEFDCGDLSGWMYKVNGRFPNYGCSRFKLKDGDAVEWVYTCDLGRDVGGDYLSNGGRGS